MKNVSSMFSAIALASITIIASSAALRAGAAIAPRSGAAMCALTPSDFQSLGIRNASKPTANVQDSGASVYCVYAGKSGATGGIELDVFYPAGATPGEIKATYETAIGEGSTVLKPIAMGGADEARWSDRAVSGGPPFASIAVRRGSLVFIIAIPTSASAQSQLTKLVEMLLQRF